MICLISGVNDQDTFSWIQSDESLNEKDTIAWVHTHVKGTPCGFSSIDVHNQYILEKTINSDIVGIVIELSETTEIWDAFVLSNEGKSCADQCSRKKNLASVQHAECGARELYYSVKSRINEVESSCKILDFRQYSCESCSKKFQRSSLLRHISHSKNCRSFYGNRFDQMKEAERSNSRTVDKQAKRKRNGDTNDVEPLKKYRRTYYEENKASYQERYQKKKDEDVEFQKKLKEKYEKELKEKLQEKYTNELKELRKSDETLKKKNKQRYQGKLKEGLKKNYEEKLKKGLQKKYEEKLKKGLQKKYEKKLKDKLQKKYNINPEPVKTYNRERYQAKKKNRKLGEEKFQDQIRDGPIFVCVCCHCKLFQNQVKVVSEKLRNGIKKHIWDKSCLELSEIKVENNFYICHNCQTVMRSKEKRPRQSIMNGMTVEQIPVELDLTCLENQLIAKNILFAKMAKLPKSRIDCIKDKVVNVPVEGEDILNTIQSFPRSFDESCIIPVQFKRMKSMKNTHLSAFVRPKVLYKALATLQAKGHPHYQNILLKCLYCDTKFSDQDNILEHINNCNVMEINTEEATTDEDIEAKESEDETLCLDAVKKFQAISDETTCVVSNFPETDVIVNATETPKIIPVKDSLSEETIILAPGNFV